MALEITINTASNLHRLATHPIQEALHQPLDCIHVRIYLTSVLTHSMAIVKNLQAFFLNN